MSRGIWITLIIVSFFIYGCGRCVKIPAAEHFCYDHISAYTDMSDSMVILNPKDSFHLNDTLWVRASFPDSFMTSEGPCVLHDSVVACNIDWMLYIANDSLGFMFFDSVQIFARQGSYSHYNIWTFVRSGHHFVLEQGFRLSTPHLNYLGSDNQSDTFPVTISSTNDSIFQRPSSSACCPPVKSGFHLGAKFRNNHLGTYRFSVR